MLGAAFVTFALAAGVQPAAGAVVQGPIAFPRPQPMSIQVVAGDRLAVVLGFDGRCTHGGVGELWIANVPASGRLRVARGTFSGALTGTDRHVFPGRVVSFAWRLSGRFTGHGAAVATVDGSAVVRSGSRVISRCRIARPAQARLSSAS